MWICPLAPETLASEDPIVWVVSVADAREMGGMSSYT